MLDKRYLVAGGVALLLGVSIAIASIRGEPQQRLALKVEPEASRLVEPRELADWIVTGRRDFAVVDMRAASEFARAHVRGAVNCGTCHESRAAGAKAMHGEGFVDLSKKLVLYTQTGAEEIVLPKLLHDNPRIVVLAGGWDRWQRDLLAPVGFDGIADEDELNAARKREAVRAFLTGERVAPTNEAKLPVAPIRRVGEHKAATGSEGC
jgi:rhodanese-related sulfurtransferase